MLPNESRHKFKVGQRVRPSQYGIDRLVFDGTYRGVKRADWSGKIVKVDRWNCPTVKWDAIKTPASYFSGFVDPDRRRGKRTVG